MFVLSHFWQVINRKSGIKLHGKFPILLFHDNSHFLHILLSNRAYLRLRNFDFLMGGTNYKCLLCVYFYLKLQTEKKIGFLFYLGRFREECQLFLIQFRLDDASFSVYNRYLLFDSFSNECFFCFYFVLQRLNKN